jgi:signal transduction histidine kinase
MTGSSPLSHPSLLPTLLAALSHELGSPLAAIKGAATTLIDYRQRLPDERVDGFLHSIDVQTDRLNDLLDDLVLLAKIQAGTLRLQPEPIALHTVIERAIAQLPPDHALACTDISGHRCRFNSGNSCTCIHHTDFHASRRGGHRHLHSDYLVGCGLDRKH